MTVQRARLEDLADLRQFWELLRDELLADYGAGRVPAFTVMYVRGAIEDDHLGALVDIDDATGALRGAMLVGRRSAVPPQFGVANPERDSVEILLIGADKRLAPIDRVQTAQRLMVGLATPLPPGVWVWGDTRLGGRLDRALTPLLTAASRRVEGTGPFSSGGNGIDVGLVRHGNQAAVVLARLS